MKCPKCGCTDDRVIDSRSARDDTAIRRRRICARCNERFTTYEEIVRAEIRVIKRDGTREDFDRQKLINGVLRACEKRPVTSAQIDNLVREITEKLYQSEVQEVSSQQLGEMLMERLHELDEVAFVRFASVYRHFADVSQFLDAVHDILGSSNKGQPPPKANPKA